MTGIAWQGAGTILVTVGTTAECPSSGTDDHFCTITFKCTGTGDAAVTLNDQTSACIGVSGPVDITNDPLDFTIHQIEDSTDTTTTTITPANSSTSSIVSSSTISSVSSLWPMVYDKMWVNKKDENILIMRAFRDEFLLNTEVGRTYVFMLYDNSLEIAILLLQEPSLTSQTREVMSKLLISVKSLLYNEEMKINQDILDNCLSLLNHFETKASPKLKIAIKNIKRDMDSKEIFEQLGITISKQPINDFLKINGKAGIDQSTCFPLT